MPEQCGPASCYNKGVEFNLIVPLLVFCILITTSSVGQSGYKHFKRGQANYEAGKLEQAIADYTKAIGLNPQLPPAYYSRGLAYADIGNLDQAIEDYTIAIELDPDFAKIYISRGNAYD